MSFSAARPAAILWDLDGTLVDTHPLIHRCVDETFQEFFSRPYEKALWERSVGHPFTYVLEQGFQEYGIAWTDTDALIRFYRDRLASYESEVAPFAGIRETIRKLQRHGIRQAVVTTKFAEAAARHLGTLGLTDCFEVVVTGDDCTRFKPDPEPFVRTLRALGLPPTRCMMVGDSAADVVGARAAGVRTVAALWGTLDVEAVHAARPDFMARRPADLLTLLRIAH